MTLQKTMPLVLLLFTIMCALPATTGAAMIPSAIAQEDDDVDENLASSIVSEVLDGGEAEDENSQDATNTANEGSNQGQDVDQDDISIFGDDTADLDDTNVAVPTAIPIDIQKEEVVEEEAPTATPPEGEPPEFVAFCVASPAFFTFLCFDTLEECEVGVGITFGGVGECEGFETLPPGAGVCVINRNNEGQPTGVACGPPP
jgi:hypothetical protein